MRKGVFTSSLAQWFEAYSPKTGQVDGFKAISTETASFLFRRPTGLSE
jgi:hypothetical protein